MDECEGEYMPVIYDLSIAKIVPHFQSINNLHFSSLLVYNLSREYSYIYIFHVQVTFFKGLGEFIDNRGLSAIMVKSKVVGSGSIKAMINRKHFNR